MYLDSVFTHGGHNILHKKFQVIVGKIEGLMAVFVMLLFVLRALFVVRAPFTINVPLTILDSCSPIDYLFLITFDGIICFR